MTQKTNEIFHVIGTDLLDYSFKVEQAIKEGWTFSTENQYAPRAWPHMFEAWMIKVGMSAEPSESKAQTQNALLSLSVASSGTSEWVDTNNENKPAVEPSNGVPKQGTRRNAKK